MASPSRRIFVVAALVTLSLSGCCCSPWFAYWHQYYPNSYGYPTSSVGRGPLMCQPASMRQPRLTRRDYRRMARLSAHAPQVPYGYSNYAAMGVPPLQMMTAYPEMPQYQMMPGFQSMDSQFMSGEGCSECSSCSSSGMTSDMSFPMEGTSSGSPVERESYDAPAVEEKGDVPLPQETRVPVGIPVDQRVLLGRNVFFNERLSHPDGQSCATCHSPDAGFADPDSSLPVSRGAISERVGSRNTPTAAYASFSPPLHYDAADESYVGGLFWDGRVNSLSEQAKLPLLNPLEMNNTDRSMVVAELRSTRTASLPANIHGVSSSSSSNAAIAWEEMADAIAAFEASNEVNAFSSKYDYFLKGQVSLTSHEQKGLELFNGKANCAACHPSTVTGSEPGPLFTDFTYDNVGIPKNQGNPFLSLPKELNPEGQNFVDHGLATTVAKIDPTRAKAQDGKFKVPTLRNVALTAPYGHNGYFKTLKEIVHFYNTRDVNGAAWPAAEITETVNHDELGDLKLTSEEEESIVAFLGTLSDGYKLSGS